ncbi:MAG TPA: hypothetical protein VJV79_27710 [Polyangiaceae bacterium]|nr:hypothetical protein [Polyangiaceae bacterium]
MSLSFSQSSELPPADFVAFLAQRSGLSEEAAEHRLEHWLDEYYATVSQRVASKQTTQLPAATSQSF